MAKSKIPFSRGKNSQTLCTGQRATSYLLPTGSWGHFSNSATWTGVLGPGTNGLWGPGFLGGRSFSVPYLVLPTRLCVCNSIPPPPCFLSCCGPSTSISSSHPPCPGWSPRNLLSRLPSLKLCNHWLRSPFSRGVPPFPGIKTPPPTPCAAHLHFLSCYDTHHSPSIKINLPPQGTFRNRQGPYKAGRFTKIWKST